MKNKKVFIKPLAFAVTVLLYIIVCCTTAWAAEQVLYEKTQETEISGGITHIYKYRLIESGWQRINMIKVDLQDENVSVDTFWSNKSITDAYTPKYLASINDAVAAVNGSFLVWGQGSSGNPIGSYLSDGKVMNATIDLNQTKDEFCTFWLTKENIPGYGFWKILVRLENRNGDTIDISRYNKAYYSYNDLSLWSSDYSKTTLGVEFNAEQVEAIIDKNGIVQEIREQLPATQIPEGGYVIMTRKAGGEQLKKVISPGDKVYIVFDASPDWSRLNTAISGGAQLIADGVIPSEFSHSADDNGKTRIPITAVATTPDGRYMYMITVDGRSKSSIGMTQYELAEYLLSLGMGNALALDGGGSTTMVTEDMLTQELSVVNSPSDGSQRAVVNILGVQTVGKSDEIAEIRIIAPKDTLSAGEECKLRCAAYNKYGNPLRELSFDEVIWDFIGISGMLDGDIYIPNEKGSLTVTAQYGEYRAEQEIHVYDKTSDKDSANKTNAGSGTKTEIAVVAEASLQGNYAFAERLSKFNSEVAVVGRVSEDIREKITTKLITNTTKGISYSDTENVRMVTLNTSAGGIRNTAADQWKYIDAVITQYSGAALILNIESGLDSFADKAEAEALKDILDGLVRRGIRVFVVTSGEEESTYSEKGISYIAIGENSNRYLKFIAKGDTVTYKFKAI